jgi:zinc protease
VPPVPARAYHCLLAAFAVALAVHDLETHRFGNGLTLHVAPGHPAPVVAVQAWIAAGSADEPPAHAGVAHVVEHMLFKGGTKYPGGELTRVIERAGGELNAWTSLDQTVYHAVLGRDQLDVALDVLAAALTAPVVDRDELAREREVILEEIRQGSDDPMRALSQSLFATAYVEHPYRRPVIGNAESVARLGERDLIEFFRRHYTGENTTLVIAGDVDVARVRRAIEKRFAAMPSGRCERASANEPEQGEPRAVYIDREVAEAHLAVGFHVPVARHPDLAAVDVAAILLGEGDAARLSRRLRDDAGLVTGVAAHVHALRDPGLLVLSATTPPRHALRALGALVEQASMLADDLTEGELERARLTVEAGFVRQLETAQSRARMVGWNSTIAGDARFAHVYLDRVRAVRRHDVATVVRRYVRANNATIATIAPARKTQRHATFARDAEHRVRRRLAVAATPEPVTEKRVELANGVVVIARRDPSVPVVAMRAVWRGGQRGEDDARAGASAMLARLVTRGCGDRDAGQVADQVDRLGGSLGGIAGRNSFALAAEWLARTWQPGFELFADCIVTPALAADEVAREQRQVQADQLAQRDNATQIAFNVFSEALYGDHPYHRDALATPDTIRGLDRDTLVKFYRDRYPVSAMKLVIVGDIDVDDAIAVARARFGAVARKTTPAPLVASPQFDGRPEQDRELYRSLDRAQAHLVIGYPGATVDASDRFALEVLVTVLGGQSGRLFEELRDKRALVYRVSAHSVEGVDPGFVAVYLACAPDKLEAALSASRTELARIATQRVGDSELERAKRYLIGSHQIAMQRRSAIANAIAYHEAYGLGWQAWTGYDAAIEAVTADDVLAAASRYLRGDRAITVTVRPPVTSAAVRQRSKGR